MKSTNFGGTNLGERGCKNFRPLQKLNFQQLPYFQHFVLGVKRACSIKVWCTKIARILRIVVQTGANLAFWLSN